MRIRLPHNYTPRDYQLPVLKAMDGGLKRGVCVWHRRAGKDKTFVNFMAKKTAERVGSYFYFLPTYAQGRKILWDGMDKSGFRFMEHFPSGYVVKANSTEMKLELKNKSIFQIVGTDNFNSVVGTNPVGCVFSEYSLQNPVAWDFIRPILRENDGWALFNFTPRGHNHGYDLSEMAKRNPDWFFQMLTVDDTKVMGPDDIQAERDSGMSEDMIQQEYYCSFEAAVPGAYYAQELRLARKQGRITKVPYQGGIPIDTWWDLGMDDSTTIWFSQDVGREIHMIDYYEASGMGLQHYARVLQDKQAEWGSIYGKHTGPHDIAVRELGTGKSRQETAKDLGLKFDVAIRVALKEDGIEASRNIFPICWFDEVKCKHGINALSSYHKDYDESKKVFRLSPVHDWASHGADAFQTLATAHKFQAALKEKKASSAYIEQYQGLGWLR